MSQRKRSVLGVIAVTATAILGILVALLVHLRDQDQFDRAQRDAAARAAEQAESVASAALGQLSTAAAFFAGSSSVTQEEFAILADSLLDRQPLSATSFTQRVTLAERPAYEKARGFPIVEPTSRGLRPAGRRPEYFPVTFAISELGDKPPFGIDVGQDPARGAALLKARDTGEPALTASVPLLRGDGSGMVAYVPIFDPDMPSATVPERRRALDGFSVGVFRSQDLIAAAMAAAPEGAEVRFTSGGKTAFGPDSQLDDPSTAALALGDRAYVLALRDPARPSLVAPGIIAASGFLIATMIAMLLTAWWRREGYAMGLVAQRMSERDAAEAQRRESEHQYRLLAENSTDLVTVMDQTGEVLYVSPSCETLLGWKPEELVGRNITEILHREDRGRLGEFAEKLLSSREVMTLECRLQHRNGDYSWMEATSRAVTEPGSSTVTEIQASARDITERMRMQSELEKLADEDPLTGLRNRRRFEEDLDAEMLRARRERAGGALVLLDLDYFKRVNDTLGHVTGDVVLREIAGVLRSRLRESDILARLGGDEFAVILPRTREAEARIVGQAIGAAIREHVPEDPDTPQMTASIGIALFDADPRATVTTVLAEADMAMYAAKDAGRDNLRFFDFQRDTARED